jgi:5-methylthioadenosine/S-adenosylhomocysteine deaminase
VDLLLRGGLVITVNPRRDVFRRGYVAVRDGVIEDVGDDGRCPYTAPVVVDTTDRVVLPGFVNAHDHLVGVYLRGLGRDQFINVLAGAPEDRLTRPIREAVDEEAAYHGARLALLELQKSGVTTVADSQPAYAGMEGRADGTLRAISESGVRALFTRGSINRTGYLSPDKHDSVDRALAELERLHHRWAGPRIEIGAEVHSLHRVEEDLLKAVQEWTRRREVHFGMHLAWSPEVAAHAVERFGRPLMLLLEEWGILDARFVGYHPVWVDEAEIAAMARSGAGAVYCPVDNMLVACGVVPVAKLLRAGVRLGLGLDQPNDGHNFFETMKMGILLQRLAGLDPGFGSPELALELGTIGSTSALHREKSVGSLEPGKAADLLVLDARGTSLNPLTGRLSNLVYAGSPIDVEHVCVAGEFVVRDGRHTRWDEQDVVRGVNQAMDGVLRRAGIERDAWPVTRWPLT